MTKYNPYYDQYTLSDDVRAECQRMLLSAGADQQTIFAAISPLDHPAHDMNGLYRQFLQQKTDHWLVFQIEEAKGSLPGDFQEWLGEQIKLAGKPSKGSEDETPPHQPRRKLEDKPRDPSQPRQRTPHISKRRDRHGGDRSGGSHGRQS